MSYREQDKYNIYPPEMCNVWEKSISIEEAWNTYRSRSKYLQTLFLEIFMVLRP